ncbi:MAG: translation initiation factor IF-2 [Verrucomicrobia bacterium]|nr:translation initiation factor IF-2 [Verrucomicrobiota bacterium]
MSIRIHELAKRHNMDGKDMLTLLKDLKFVTADTRSVSSTVSPIYEEELEKYMASKAPAAPAAAPVAAVTPAPVAAKVPMVKSAGDVVRERAETAARAAAEATETVEPRPPAPVVAAPAPAAPAVVSAPAPLNAPRPVSVPPSLPVSRPPSVVSPVSSPRPAPSIPSPGLRPAAVPMMLRPSPPPAPAPASAPAAPAAPAVIHAPNASPAPVPSFSAPPRPPATPVASPATSAPKAPPSFPNAVNNRPTFASTLIAPAPAATITEEGGVKIIHLKPPIIVRDFATTLGMKPFKLISELMEAGIFASINQSIDELVAAKVAEKHGYLLDIKHRGETTQVPQVSKKEKEAAKAKKEAEDESKNLVMRPPVVCILGHVDHGKTSLLDAIRKANVASGEAGGITQHIGAYQIEHSGRKITFLDTPGHAAFNKMRARGASVTDVAILVVAADDGFMPQTDEALKHAQSAAVTTMVAVNKMDVKGANLDRVKQQMQERNIAPEDWGGETVTVPVSALKGTGLSELLDMIILQADILELKANPKAEAAGVVIESQVDVGRGPLATLLIQRGTLKVGDSIVCGAQWCKVRAMFDDKGANIKEAPPAMPVRVIGWSGAPDSGVPFKAAKNAREAEDIAEEEQMRVKKAATTVDAAPKNVSVDQLFADIAANQAKVLKLIIKTDVFGSTEAVRHVLDGIKSTKVSVEVVSTEVGLVTKNDVLMAGTGGAVIIGFNTKLEPGVTPLAKHHGVRIETYGIIYELADKVKEMMADLLDPDLKEVKLGAAEVRATFPLAKGFVAGCLVTEGKITRNANARLRRKKDIVAEGKIDTLKRFKDDANEVRAGLECGIKLGDFNGYDVGDVIEVYEIQKVRASL